MEFKCLLGFFVLTSLLLKLFYLCCVLTPLSLWAQAQQTTNDFRPTLAIRLDQASSGNKFCESILSAINFHLDSSKRYATKFSSAPEHVLGIACDAAHVNATWTTFISKRTKRKQKLLPRQISEAKVLMTSQVMNSPAAISLKLLRAIDESLIWDGEISKSVSVEDEMGNVRSKDELGIPLFYGGPGRKGEAHAISYSSVGVIANELLGSCMPLEIGAVNWDDKLGTATFRPVGFGVMNIVEDYQAKLETYVPKDSFSLTSDRLYYRFGESKPNERWSKLMVKKCRKKVGELARSTLDGLLSQNVSSIFTAESIELNSIDERMGISLFKFAGDNGQNTPLNVGAYFHNTIGIGDYLGVDIRGMRHVISKPYEPVLGGAVQKSDFTLAEGAMLLRFGGDSFDLHLGGGLGVDKINIPYKIKSGEGTALRKVAVRPIGLIRMGGSWGVTSSYVRVSMSPSQANKYLAIDWNLDLRLTKTWYFGADVMMVSVGQSKLGEPGGKLVGVGFHLGFNLERVKN